MTPRRRLVLALSPIVFLGLAAAGVLPDAHADETTFQNLMDRARQTLREAERLWNAGDPGARPLADRVDLLLEQADSQRSGEPAVALVGVETAVIAGDPARARRWLDRYAKRSPYGEDDPDLYYARALIAYYLDEVPGRAVALLRRMNELSPKAGGQARNLLYYRSLMAEGARLVQGSAFGDAVPLFQEAARRAIALGDHKKELAARGNAGISLDAAGRHDDAEVVFHHLADEDPRNPTWAWYRAESLAGAGKLAEALPVYERVLALLPESHLPSPDLARMQLAWLRLGNVHRGLAAHETDPAKRRAELAEAEKDFRRMVELEPDLALGHYWLGVVLYEDLKRPYEAVEELERARTLDPVSDAALEFLIRIGTQNGPPPTDDPAAAAKAHEAWAERLAAWRKDYEDHKAERADQRRTRPPFPFRPGR